MPKGKKTDEMAKLGREIVKVSEKAGRWVDEVFGEGARQVGAAFADSMTGFKVRNRLKVLQKTQKAIEKAGLSGNTRPLSERMRLPIWEAIGEESDETLQDVWAAYIRNAVDPRQPNPDRILIDIIRKLEPSDWPILKKIFSLPKNIYTGDDFKENVDVINTLDRLSILGVLEYDDDRSVYIVVGPRPETLTFKIGNGTYYETRLLHKLANSISVGA